MDAHDFAWAAGFFDGEGWAASRERGVAARINQASSDGIPEVLNKFQRIVTVGRLKGPVISEGKQPLFYWEATSRPDVTRVADLIGPWLGVVKRAEFERTLRSHLSAIAWPGSSSEELAWAAGFFDGEGSTYLLKHRTHLERQTPAVEVPQSGWDGVPAVLVRFRAALSGIGHINGPHVYAWTDAPVSRWKSEARDDVQLVLHRLMPFLSTVKREQACGC